MKPKKKVEAICPTCSGRGYATMSDGSLRLEDCPVCQGKGWFYAGEPNGRRKR